MWEFMISMVIMRRLLRFRVLFLGGFLASCCLSCNLLTPLVFLGNPKKKISPEFDKLPGARAAILVWTDQATLFDYPYARFELASYVRDKLASELGQRKSATDLIDSRTVEDFIQKNVDAQIDPVAVGRQFKTDFVIYLEVVRFQMRSAGHAQLLQGVIEASVSVHDLRAGPSTPIRYELLPVQTIYPEGQPILMTASNSVLVRESTYRKFAEQVARKFYEHSIDL